MLKGLIIFAAGVYTGIYASQNYEVPKVNDPAKLFTETMDKLKQFAEDNKKKELPDDNTVKIIEKTIDLVKTIADDGKKK